VAEIAASFTRSIQKFLSLVVEFVVFSILNALQKCRINLCLFIAKKLLAVVGTWLHIIGYPASLSEFYTVTAHVK
jgi:hypothetical protein